jgi:hypothetical protein
MVKIAITVLLIVAWHFPTTFFVPGGTGQPASDTGSLIWPFGRASGPILAGVPSFVAPSSLTSFTNPSIAMAAAGIASLAFLVALFSLWGVVIPADWWRGAAIVGSVSSIVLFVLYLGPWAIIPIAVDLFVLWGVFVQDWTQSTFTGA